MRQISRDQLEIEAEITGFRIEILEKVLQLMRLLQAFAENPFLHNRIALKGGTALNLFYFEYPRLSVDIDLNYVGSLERDIMDKERLLLTSTMEELCKGLGFMVQKKLSSHAGEKWVLRYVSVMHGMGNLMIDLNFLLRMPLWPIVWLDSFKLGSYQLHRIPTPDKHEVAGGKLRAFFSRHSSRDLFDVHQILLNKQFDSRLLRIAFVVYGAMSREDWRRIKISDIHFKERELRNMLIPLLRKSEWNTLYQPNKWSEHLLEECKHALSLLLPFRQNEIGFLDKLLDEGEIFPSLICKDDHHLSSRIVKQPGLLWKSTHIKQHKVN